MSRREKPLSRRTRYRIEWRKLGSRAWTELGTPGGRADTFRTSRAAERKARWLEDRQFGGVRTRVVDPAGKRRLLESLA